MLSRCGTRNAVSTPDLSAGSVLRRSSQSVSRWCSAGERQAWPGRFGLEGAGGTRASGLRQDSALGGDCGDRRFAHRSDERRIVLFVGLVEPRENGLPVPPLAAWSLGVGIVATVGANLAHGLGHGPIGAPVSAWPAVAPDVPTLERTVRDRHSAGHSQRAIARDLNIDRRKVKRIIEDAA